MTKAKWLWRLLIAGFVLFSLAEIAWAADPQHPGWGGISIEKDPAGWVIEHADIHLDKYAYTKPHVAGCADLIAKFVDFQARANCGQKRATLLENGGSYPHYPAWAQVPGFHELRRLAGVSIPRGQQVDVIAERDSYHKAEKAFPQIVADLINRRIQEIRWPQESRRPLFSGVLNGAKPVEGPIVFLGNHVFRDLYTEETWSKIASAIDRRGSNLPVIWMLDNNSEPFATDGRVTVIRKMLSLEHHPLQNDGRLHFNSDRLLAIGTFGDASFTFFRAMLQYAFHDALSYAHRTQVDVDIPVDPRVRVQAAIPVDLRAMVQYASPDYRARVDVEIPLDLWIDATLELAGSGFVSCLSSSLIPCLRSDGHGGLLGHTIASKIALFNGPSPVKMQPDEFANHVDNQIREFANALTTPWPSQAPIMDGTQFVGDIEIHRSHPENELSLERTVMFTRADNKRVNFVFTCPFDAAELHARINERAPYGYAE